LLLLSSKTGGYILMTKTYQNCNRAVIHNAQVSNSMPNLSELEKSGASEATENFRLLVSIADSLDLLGDKLGRLDRVSKKFFMGYQVHGMGQDA
jgi:hypothetical protein